MIVDVDSFVVPFVIFCDDNGLSLSRGKEVAEMVAEELLSAADDRRYTLPPELVDEEEDE